jgi:hypothetical protein
VQHGPDGPKQRLVWGYPQSITLAEAQFARPLINAFVAKRSPMAFGKLRFQLSAEMTTILNAHCRYGFDMSRFDASVSPRLIKMAFAVLSHNFDLSPQKRREWNMVRDYFIHTPILMPDGNVYIKHRGVPSGSYFTQLVDSVVNFFIIQYAYMKIVGRLLPLDKIRVLGDDSLFSSNVAISMKHFRDTLETVGFTLNIAKSCVAINDSKVEFLGHVWNHGLVDRDPRLIAQRMIYPERHSDEADPRQRIRNRIYPYLNDGISAYKSFSSIRR